MDVRLVATEIDVVETVAGKVHDDSNVILDDEFPQSKAQWLIDDLINKFDNTRLRFYPIDDFSFKMEFLNCNGDIDVVLEATQINNKMLIETGLAPKPHMFNNYH